MTSDRYTAVRKAAAPDLWPEIERRIATGGPTGPNRGPAVRHRWRLVVSVGATLVVLVGSLALVWSVLAGRSPSGSAPAGSVPGGAFVVRITAPPRSVGAGLPTATASFGGSHGPLAIDAASGSWGTPQPYRFTTFTTDFALSVPVGTSIAVTGDATTTTVRFDPGGADRLWSVAPIALRSGIGRIPDRPGNYVLGVTAAWPNRSARFAIAIHVIAPSLNATPFDCRVARDIPPGTAGIAGSLRFLFTAGPLSASFDAWAASKPHSGVIQIEDRSTGRSITLQVLSDGRFGVSVPAGTYRITVYIPGIHEQGIGDGPLILVSRTVTAGAGQCRDVRMLVWEGLP